MREAGIYDKFSQSFVSHDGTQSVRLDDACFDTYAIFHITRHSKEERRKYAEKFRKQEDEKAQEMRKIRERMRAEEQKREKEREEKLEKEKEERRKKREDKMIRKTKAEIKEEEGVKVTNDSILEQPKKKRVRKKKDETEMQKSPPKRVRRKPAKASEKTLSELIKDILPNDYQQDSLSSNYPSNAVYEQTNMSSNISIMDTYYNAMSVFDSSPAPLQYTSKEEITLTRIPDPYAMQENPMV